MNIQAQDTLKNLFSQIGWEKRFDKAIYEECAKASLHGLADSAYSEWGDYAELLTTRQQERKEQIINARVRHSCYGEHLDPDLEDWDLYDWVRSLYPDAIFTEDPDWGLRWARGRLFSLRDYQEAKEAIANLGEDRFERSFFQKFGRKVPANAHLWEE